MHGRRPGFAIIRLLARALTVPTNRDVAKLVAVGLRDICASLKSTYYTVSYRRESARHHSTLLIAPRQCRFASEKIEQNPIGKTLCGYCTNRLPCICQIKVCAICGSELPSERGHVSVPRLGKVFASPHTTTTRFNKSLQ
jgi:hypothetical protein